MNGIAGAMDAEVVVAALAVLALILLLLAGWLGRWPLWVAGWAVAVIALAVVFHGGARP